VESFEQVRLALRLAAKGAPVRVYGVDILPRMSDYVVPPGVRIADADRIRLGAYLAEGTTVSHEGLVTYNAGTLGAAVIQGRLSEGVVVQAGTTVGGGASIMGTDPGSAHISVGRDCLLGANAGVGISLGDACTVEAGLYVTAGTKVNLVAEGEEMVVPARELAGRSGLVPAQRCLRCSGGDHRHRRRGTVGCRCPVRYRQRRACGWPRDQCRWPRDQCRWPRRHRARRRGR